MFYGCKKILLFVICTIVQLAAIAQQHNHTENLYAAFLSKQPAVHQQYYLVCIDPGKQTNELQQNKSIQFHRWLSDTVCIVSFRQAVPAAAMHQYFRCIHAANTSWKLSPVLQQLQLTGKAMPPAVMLRAGDEEQYRTTNLVTGLPRVIKIKVTNLGTAFVSGADLAIARYNALGLKMTFQRITTGSANITIQGFNQGPSGGYITLGSSGFPTSSGAPYGTIKMNTNQYAYGSNPNVNYVGSVIQHELGHCIGMRHTDYYNRAISCGGTATNEGASTIGAILIPGTPGTATLSAGSWMLACSNGGNRTFNTDDVTALNYLYK